MPDSPPWAPDTDGPRQLKLITDATGLQGPAILVPALAGLGAALADLAATLPVGDANARLLASLDGLDGVPAELVAGVFANDPFRRGDALLGALQARGVRAVINWPSVGLLEGELAAAYRHSGFSLEAELAWLQRAQGCGLHALALVRGAAAAEAAVAAGIDALVVAPGLAVPDAARRREAAAEASAVVARLLAPVARPGMLVYAHPEFAGLLDAACKQADGTVVPGEPARAAANR